MKVPALAGAGGADITHSELGNFDVPMYNASYPALLKNTVGELPARVMPEMPFDAQGALVNEPARRHVQAVIDQLLRAAGRLQP